MNITEIFLVILTGMYAITTFLIYLDKRKEKNLSKGYKCQEHSKEIEHLKIKVEKIETQQLQEHDILIQLKIAIDYINTSLDEIKNSLKEKK